MGAAWLLRHRHSFHQKTALRWGIVPAGSHHSIGTIGLTFGSEDEPFAVLSIVIARAWRRKGLGSEATNKVVDYAFTELRVSEIRAEVLQRNQASIRLLQKMGFDLARALPPCEEEPEPMFLYALSRDSVDSRA